MPNFKFQGFPVQANVALSVVQGALSDSASVSTWGESSNTTLTVSLSATRTTMMAPGGAIYYENATSTAPRVDSAYHDVEGPWSFGDTGDYTALDNSPLWGVEKNVAHGPRTVYVHDTPGNYTISKTGYDGTSSTVGTLNITVQDPFTEVFSAADIAVVSGSSNFADKPTGAQEFTSIASAMSYLSGRTLQCLLLRDTETFTDTIEFEENSGSGRRVLVGKFGSSASSRPFLDVGTNSGVTFGGSAYDEIAVRDLIITGSYDATALSPPARYTSDGISFSKNVSGEMPLLAHKTIWNCDISGVGKGINSTGLNSPEVPNSHVYVGNTKVSNWYDYGMFAVRSGTTGLCGCSIRQPEGTRNGNGKNTSPYWADHGPFRQSDPEDVCVISNCDLASYNGWPASSNNRTFQPPVRWHAGGSGTANPDKELVLDRVRAEGGQFNLYTATGGGAGVTDNFVVCDRLYIVNSDHAKQPILSPMGGVTIRNSIVVVPNIPAGGSNGIISMFSDDDGGDATAGSQTRRSELYSCALIDLRSDANASSRTGNQDRDFNTGGFDNITNSFFGSNILHAPNMVTGGNTAHAPLDTTPQFSTTYAGEAWQTSAIDTTRRYGDAPLALWKPETGSAAIGAATGKVSLVGFNGNLRADVLAGLSRSTPSVGPFEPNEES